MESVLLNWTMIFICLTWSILGNKPLFILLQYENGLLQNIIIIHTDLYLLATVRRSIVLTTDFYSLKNERAVGNYPMSK